MKQDNIISERTNLRTRFWSFIIGVIGLGLIIAAETSETIKSIPSIKALSSEIGSVLVVSISLTIFWELSTKRDFFAEIMHHVQLSENIKQAGVKSIEVTASYISDFDWRGLIGNAKNVDILVAYGGTWRRSNRGTLTEFAKKSGTKMRVILPDPENTQLIQELARRFNSTLEDVQREIQQAKTEFISLFTQAGAKAKLEIWYHSASPVFSCYVFDNEVIFATYRHRPGQSIPIPMFSLGNGTLSTFVRDELAALTDPESKLARRAFPKEEPQAPTKDKGKNKNKGEETTKLQENNTGTSDEPTKETT